MAKKMLINALHPEEARVAIVEDGLLVDLGVEIAGHEETRGNVYKGIVVRVEQGLQAAFVDIGLKKLGFLQMGEIHPDNWQWRDEVPVEQRNRRPRIQEILRRGQELIVQVEKGERDNKGAALTTYISLPGRYMVVMPKSDSTGISRKVEGEAERKKLKEAVVKLEIPEDIGYIVRTEAVGKRKTELAKDLQYLLKLYARIKEQAASVKDPSLIYQESNLAIRSIRDYFTAEIDEVLVDSKEVYKETRAFFKEIMPTKEKLVKLHLEKRPIFSKYQLEEQIDMIFEKRVPLTSGGSLVIDQTEALVSIDVNSGKATGERGIEDTAFKTNMEAAEEAARQLRLRDLGGLIVIDFIDMRERKHNAEVEKKLKHALKADKARTTVGKISQFGLLELSRQRIKQTLNEGSYLLCPHCSGQGKVKSVETMALSFLRKVHAAACKGNVAEVHGSLPLDVAYYLLNRKKVELTQLEADYDIEITVKGKPSFLLNELELSLVKRERPLHLEAQPDTKIAAVTQEKTATPERPEEQGEVEGEKPGKRKRKRSKKKTTHGAPEADQATGELSETTPAEPVAEQVMEQARAPEDEAAPEEGKKKRRRKRRRGKKHHADELAGTEGAPTEPTLALETADVSAAETAGAEPVPSSPPDADEQLHDEAKKKRRRRKRRPTKPHSDAATGDEVAIPPAEEAAPVVPEPATAPHPESVPGEPVKRPPRKPSVKKAKPDTAPPQPSAEQIPEAIPVPPAPQPKPARRKRASAGQKIVTSPADLVEREQPERSPEVTVQPESAPVPQKLPRMRAPRKKTPDPAGEHKDVSD